MAMKKDYHQIVTLKNSDKHHFSKKKVTKRKLTPTIILVKKFRFDRELHSSLLAGLRKVVILQLASIYSRRKMEQ